MRSPEINWSCFFENLIGDISFSKPEIFWLKEPKSPCFFFGQWHTPHDVVPKVPSLVTQFWRIWFRVRNRSCPQIHGFQMCPWNMPAGVTASDRTNFVGSKSKGTSTPTIFGPCSNRPKGEVTTKPLAVRFGTNQASEQQPPGATTVGPGVKARFTKRQQFSGHRIILNHRPLYIDPCHSSQIYILQTMGNSSWNCLQRSTTSQGR